MPIYISVQGIKYYLINRTFWVLHKNTSYLIFFFENFPKRINVHTFIRDTRVYALRSDGGFFESLRFTYFINI